MSVYKHSGGRHWSYDFRQDGQRYRGTAPISANDSKAKALRWLRDHRHQIVNASAKSASGQLTMSDALLAYWNQHGFDLKGSANTEKHVLEWIAAFPPTLRLIDLTDADVRAAAKRLEVPTPTKGRRGRVVDRRSPSTVRRYMKTLSAVWNFHLKGKGIPAPDWTALMPRETEVPTITLSDDAFAAFMAFLPEDRCPLHLFALMTGLRLNSILQIRNDDVEIRPGSAGVWVDIEKKSTGTQRDWVRLNPSLLKIVQAELGKHPTHLFSFVAQVTSGSGDRRREKGKRYRYTEQTAQNDINRARKAGILPAAYHFHCHRHTAGTRARRETGDLALVKRLLRHSSITSTLRYAQVDDDDVAAAQEAIAFPKLPKSVPKSSGKKSKGGAK